MCYTARLQEFADQHYIKLEWEESKDTANGADKHTVYPKIGGQAYRNHSASATTLKKARNESAMSLINSESLVVQFGANA
ncbi:hypothetical protein RhiTH_009714 [Rhizoctonia solani]